MRRLCKPETALAVVGVYGSFLLSSPGRVSADSKQYLYLDPGAFLSRTVELWDPSIGAGTVPHQHLGYAFPVAPLFWALDAVGLPDWVAQRLWLATLTFVALLGARWLFLQLGLGRVAAFAGALVYGLSPYQLAFTARISVLLLPWAALPWLVGLTMRATRERSWRAPALAGVVLLLAGGINASSLLLVGLAPVLWVAFEVGRGRPGPALAGAGRVAILAVGVSVWWLVGVRLQGAYGLPVLQLTENLRTVAERSLPGDVLRGLGNWFFYGRDPSGFSIDQAGDYDGNGLVVALSYAVPVAALMAALLVRWAHRAYFVVLVLVGTVVAVGSWPFDDPSPYGRAWRAFADETSLGLAFRNSPRAVPLVVLGLAGLLAAGVAALPRPPWSRLGGAAVAVLAVGALLPVARTGWLSDGVDRPEEIPAYWQEAIADLDRGDHRTRILELPGSSFAAYRWGNLIDPLTPGLTDRPYLAREVLPYGTAPSVNLLDALDRRAQLGILDPTSIAPTARLLGVGTIVLRADLERSDRGFSPDPGPVWHALLAAPGLEPPRRYGPPGGDGTDPDLPAVALFDVTDPRPILHTAAVDSPVVLGGDGDGIVDAASAGLLGSKGVLFEASALDVPSLADVLDNGAHLLLTDSNRRRSQVWFYGLQDTRGHTEPAGERAADPRGYDFRLEPFDDADDDDRTVVELEGGTVQVTSDGGTDRPEDRGPRAVDGDPVTAWRVGGPNPLGQAITIAPALAPTADHLWLLQPPSATTGRALSTVRLTVGEGPAVEVALGPDSLEAPGQEVRFPEQVVSRVEVVVTGVVGGTAADPFTPVGLAEVAIDDVEITEVVRLPLDLLERVGERLIGHGLDLVLTRLRAVHSDPTRLDEEASLERRFELPAGRTFRLSGAARPAGPPMAASPPEGCRDDLLTIDGQPVPARLVAAPSGHATVEGCGPVPLAAGSHRLSATGGTHTGWDIDQVVLSADAAGDPLDPAPRGSSAAGPPLEAVGGTGARAHAEVATGGRPFWLVLGQSASDGWALDASEAGVGARTLVDGYANGWLVTPTGGDAVRVEAVWTPQRLVWAGLAVSALAALACGLLLLRSRGAAAADLGDRPRLRLPGEVAPCRWREVALASGVVGAGAVMVATPPVAVAAVVLTGVAGRVRRGRIVLLVAAPGALVASRMLSERPSLAWLAVAALAADLLLSRREERSLG